MVDFWEATRDILMVVGPTLIGAISSKYIINSWQNKREEFNLNKEKFDLRKLIVTDYQKSYIHKFVLLFSFLTEVFDQYNKPTGFGDKDKTTDFNTFFPNDKSLQPLALFEKKYKELTKKIDLMLYDQWDFYATVHIYYDDEELVKKIDRLALLQDNLLASLSMLVHSKDVNDLQKNSSFIDSIGLDCRILQVDIAKMLANSPIRKPSN